MTHFWDYLLEINRAKGRRAVRAVASAMRRLLRRQGYATPSVVVVHGHRTAIIVREVRFRDLVAVLKAVLEPGIGSALIARLRGIARAWLVRPWANRTLIRLT